MRIFVTGATGAIGIYAVRALLAAGLQVTALSRSTAKAEILTTLGALPKSVSLFDEAGLIHAFTGHDAVVNLATAIPSTSRFMRKAAWSENDRIRSEGSKVLVEAALKAGIPTVIQESVSMIYRDRRDVWIDEQWPTERFPMSLGNHAAEASANHFTQQGGAGIVLRFGWFYGPGAAHSEEFFRLAQRYGIGVMMGAANTYVSSIHMEDAGSAVAAALELPAGTYNVVDDEPVTKSAYADALAASAGVRLRIKAPGRLAELLGNKTTSLTRSLRVSNAHFRKLSGWVPKYRNVSQGWQATADVLANSA